MKGMRFLIFLLTFLFCTHVGAQTAHIENLKRAVKLAATDEQKLQSIFTLCDVGYNLNPDTLIAYAQQAGKIAIRHSDKHALIVSMFHTSGALTTKGLIDSSLQITNQCLSMLSTNDDDHVLLANIYNQQGRCFMRKNKYKEAIDRGYKVVEEAEIANNVLLQLKGKTLIGWAYLEMGQPNKALVWHLNALRTTSDTAVLENYAILFANLAINYRALNNSDSAFYFINKAVLYARKHENLFALANSLAIQAQCFVRAGKSALAEAPLKEVVAIRKLIGDPFYIVSDMSQLGLYYANIGEPKKGIAICNEGIAIANTYKIGTKLFFLYSSLAENYKAMGDHEKYAGVLERLLVLKDSVYQANSAEALAEMQTRYDLERKENIIIEQQLSLVRKNYWMFGSLLIFLLAALLTYILFTNYRRRQDSKLKLMMAQERKIGSEAVLRAEENERKRIAADLHDNMGAYASAISANVDDLLTQDAADKHVLNAMKVNAAEIMLNLRDTIWVLNKESILLTGISDRFKNYVQKISKSYEGIDIKIEEHIANDVSLSPEKSLNMLRIMQEAFHNAVKHSRCTQILVKIESGSSVKVTIRDNGVGMDSLVEELDSHGLNNMHLRAKLSGWTLVIQNLVPDGTAVELLT